MEDATDETGSQSQNAVVYLSSSHKLIFLRIISAERNFIRSNLTRYSTAQPFRIRFPITFFVADPELYPEYVSIMTAELNGVDGVERSESDWLQIMNAWISGVKDDYQSFIRSK